MKKFLWILLVSSLCVLTVTAMPQLGQLKTPTWAFQIIDPVLPPQPEGAEPISIPGSSKQFTRKEIENLSAPPDWFPDQNTPKPDIILRGRAGALACGSCHLMSGLGHPESADLAGLPASYIFEQLVDFKSGARKDISRMNGIAQAMTDEEMRQASAWFAARKPVGWNKTEEASMVPKTYIGPGRMRFPHPDGGTEPIGSRIVTLPQDASRARSRDPNSGFIAYVPAGSIKRGEALVKTGGGGKTIACTICHGDDLKGLADVPRLAGTHPIYIARQLYIFKNGERNGLGAQLMKKPVAQLTDEDIVAISAYLGSLAP